MKHCEPAAHAGSCNAQKAGIFPLLAYTCKANVPAAGAVLCMYTLRTIHTHCVLKPGWPHAALEYVLGEFAALAVAHAVSHRLLR